MLDRLKEYIDYKGISTSRFEKSIGMSNASFGKSLKNNGTIGADKLEIILNVYPDLNLCWLITGKGEMIINYESDSPPSLANEKEDSYYKSCVEKDKVISAQSQTIDTLQKYILCLEDELEQKKPAEDGQKRKAG